MLSLIKRLFMIIITSKGPTIVLELFYGMTLMPLVLTIYVSNMLKHNISINLSIYNNLFIFINFINLFIFIYLFIRPVVSNY